ncbi:MAG: hypothetical protein QXX99_04715 [Candidatus Bathyarchaeia archaeon]
MDSSLTACIAVEALGRENVIGVYMPSKYLSQHGKEDVRKVAENLGILFIEIPIQEIIESYQRIMEKPLEAEGIFSILMFNNFFRLTDLESLKN